MTKPNPVIVHYLIKDSDDGSASLILFKTPKALEEYVADLDDYQVIQQGKLRQNDIDQALSLDQVRAEKAANEVVYFDVEPYWPFHK